MAETKKYQGYIGLIGKPNVGKSSLINAIIGKKVVITNNKPQTTRNIIKALFENDQFQLLLIDTPGYHKPINELDIYLNNLSESILKKVDLIFFLIDGSRAINDEDIDLLNFLNIYQKSNVVVIITKIDLINNINNFVDNTYNTIKKYINPLDIIPVSSLKNNNIDFLLSKIKNYLCFKTPNQFDNTSSWDDDKFLIKEIIREKCLELLNHEVPYGIAIHIDSLDYKEKENLLYISASIVVEKESQKSIVIGKNGRMIKEIGIKSRTDLNQIYNSKIVLKLFVKVDKNWRSNPNRLKLYGYGD